MGGKCQWGPDQLGEKEPVFVGQGKKIVEGCCLESYGMKEIRKRPVIRNRNIDAKVDNKPHQNGERAEDNEMPEPGSQPWR